MWWRKFLHMCNHDPAATKHWPFLIPMHLETRLIIIMLAVSVDSTLFTASVVPWKQMLWEKLDKEGDVEGMPLTVDGGSYTKPQEVFALPRKIYSDKLQADLSLSACSPSRCVCQTRSRSCAQFQQHSTKNHMPDLTYLALMFLWGFFGDSFFSGSNCNTIPLPKCSCPVPGTWRMPQQAHSCLTDTPLYP